MCMQEAGMRLSKALKNITKAAGIATEGLENIQDCADLLVNASYATSAVKESERNKNSGAGNGGYKGKRGPLNQKGSNMASPQDTGGQFSNQGGSQGGSQFAPPNGSMPGPMYQLPGNGLQMSPQQGPQTHWRPQQQVQGQAQRS